MVAALVASCLLMAVSCLGAQVLRIVVGKLLAAEGSSLARMLCLEFIAAAELCAVCFELIVGKLTIFHFQHETIAIKTDARINFKLPVSGCLMVNYETTFGPNLLHHGL